MLKGQMLNNMISLAVEAHNNQFDKGGMPYILHPLKVMHYLKTDDEELQCIAIGHDIIEDTYVTALMLEKKGFTPRVISGINALTKIKNEALEDYMVRICDNTDAMRVKLCDLRHNSDIRRLKGVTEKDMARLAKYAQMYTLIEASLNT